MATWSTDFGTIPDAADITAHGWEDESGDGWTYDTSGPALGVVDAVNAPVSDRWIEVTPSQTSTHQPMGWKPPTVPAVETDRLQVCAVVWRSSVDGIMHGVIGRAENRYLDARGVMGVFRNNTTQIRYVDYVDGENDVTFYEGDLHGVTDPNDWTVVVLDLNGSTASVKAWAYGDPEPAGWQYSGTTTVTAAGWPGIGGRIWQTGRTVRWGYFSWGSDGDAAPRPGGASANTAPVVDAGADDTATEGAAYSHAVSATDADVGDTITLTCSTLPTGLTFTDNGDGSGTIAGTPGAGTSSGSPYTVTVTANDGTTTATDSYILTVVAAAVDVPTGLAAETAPAVGLSWTAVTGADSYDLEKDSTIIETGLTGTAYIDTAVTFDTEYSYRVRTDDGGVKSDWTTAVTHTPTATAATQTEFVWDGTGWV